MAQLMRQSSLLEQPKSPVSASVASSRSGGGVPSWLRSDKTKIVGSIALLIIAAVIMFFSFSGDDVVPDSKTRLAIDSETGQTYTVRIVEGDSFPWKNPDTNKDTLYPVERCFWTRDGKAKLQPTLVFVKAYLGSKEKTVCPDCGRDVRQHNPMPPGELMAEAK